MKTHLYVVSDLHLGGESREDGRPGFQMCPPRNVAALESFVLSLPAPTKEDDRHLVLAGDVVDFLAEQPFLACTVDDGEAAGKLARIMGRTAGVWEVVRAFVGRGGALTILLGNHDIEMSLPSARRLLLDRLGPGRVEFIYDNQALAVGDVLIEHGNRYDSWNAVRHDQLRRLRSSVSRKEAETFEPPPGSQLVAELMNPIKERYRFVDLLKPEAGGVMPLLAALGEGDLQQLWQVFRKYRRAAAVRYDEDRRPLEDEFIADDQQTDPVHPRDQEAYKVAMDILSGGNAEEIAWGGDSEVNAVEREVLLRAWRHGAEYLEQTFAIDREDSDYARAFQAAARRGYKVVIYGHTHLAKHVRADLGGTTAEYLNTGTWADLIRIPPAILRGGMDTARREFDKFLHAIEHNQLDPYRTLVPTYAHVVLEKGRAVLAGVYEFDGRGSKPLTAETMELADRGNGTDA